MTKTTAHIEKKEQLVPVLRFPDFEDEWKNKSLKEVLSLTTRPFKMDDETNYSLVTVKRRYGGVVPRGIFKGKEIKVKSQFLLKKNDFLISKRQISHNACGIVPRELEDTIVSNEYSVFVPQHNLDIDYFNYFCHLPKVSRTFFLSSIGVHIEKMIFKVDDWFKWKFSFPSLPEQQKIVAFLGTVDDKIRQLTRKKDLLEQYKKGVMQKLFSQELRFKDENGKDYSDWEVKKVTDLAKTSIGLVTTMTKNYTETGVALIRNSDIKQNKIKKGSLIYLNHLFANANKSRQLLVNDIVTVHTGDIGVSAVIDDDLNGCQGFATLNTRIKDHGKISSEYLCWYYNSQRNIKYAMSMATGDGRSNYNLKDFNRAKIPTPCLEEQQKIADYLSAIDNKIESVTNQITQTQTFKKGLLQQMFV